MARVAERAVSGQAGGHVHAVSTCACGGAEVNSAHTTSGLQANDPLPCRAFSCSVGYWAACRHWRSVARGAVALVECGAQPRHLFDSDVATAFEPKGVLAVRRKSRLAIDHSATRAYGASRALTSQAPERGAPPLTGLPARAAGSGPCGGVGSD